MKIFLYFAALLCKQILDGIRHIFLRARWRAKGVNIGRNVMVLESRPDSIVIEKDVFVGQGCLLIATDEMAKKNGPVSHLEIKTGTAINEYCNIRACGGEILIGEKCLIAQFVSIIASNHSVELGVPMIEQQWATNPHSVIIGDDVWIGANVVLLPGANIGSGAIIAAGAVVRGLVPSREIWGGVPARFIKKRAN